jgi:2-polyprenyl-6-methoxyphenol hydroxylase-like FAD-dependent oxidoreductase
MYEHLRHFVVQPEDMNIRRWQNGDVIGRTKLGHSFEADFDVPYYVVHRAHLHEALCTRAKQLGVRIELNKTVVGYDPQNGSVLMANGSIISGDLVVAADGTRHNFCGEVTTITFVLANAFKVLNLRQEQRFILKWIMSPSLADLLYTEQLYKQRR